MTEEFISYIWFNNLFFGKQKTLLGEEVVVVSPGVPNRDSGADVFNAKVNIGDRLWAGNVEFHVRASDWHRHHHDTDSCYDKLILHVVLVGDEQIFRSDGTPLPTVQLSFPDWMLDRYRSLVSDKQFRCIGNVEKQDMFSLHHWFDRLFTERIEEKIGVIRHIMSQNGNNWEETFYVVLSRAFGFGTNSDAMQALACSIPLSVIMHHRDNIEQIEALFLGQAGLLDKIPEPSPEERIWVREYGFLRKKFALRPYKGPAFKFMRMRPYGFPSMRMAQFAALLHKTEHLLRQVIESEGLDDLYALFDCAATDYWKTRFSPASVTQPHSCKLTRKSINILIINAVVPFLFHYGRERNDYSLLERVEKIMRDLPPEQNSKISGFIAAGIPCENAYDSQSLIQLHKFYCSSRNCLRCYFGRRCVSLPNSGIL